MTSSWLTKTTITAATMMVAAVAWGQWSFTLDTTFRTQIVQQNVNDLHLLPDGGLFLSGRMRFADDMFDRGSAKLLNDGTRDPSFPSFPQTTGGGKIVAWQNAFYVQPAATVRRMTPEGLVDPSFISMNSNPAFQSQTGGDYHVFPDGRVLLSGSHILSDTARGFVGQYRLVWFSNEGYLDTTRTHRQANGTIWEFKELPDGKFICTCSCSQYEGQPVSRVFRIHADGSLDTTFNAGVNWGNIFAYHPLPDGRVYVGGRYKRAAAPDDTLYLARFMPDGSLDPTFLPTALSPGTLPNPSLGAAVVAITPWHNGTLLVGGRFRHVNGADRNSICLLEADGTLNNAFDGQGVGVFTFASTAYTTVAQILPDSSGQWIYICGAYASYDDGTTIDPDQRFVSRLLVSELSVGVQEQAPPQTSLHLWPNPSNQQTWLSYSLLGNSGPVQLRIRSAQGRIAHTLQASGEEGQVVWDTRSIAPGVYTVELLREGQVERTERLVIQP